MKKISLTLFAALLSLAFLSCSGGSGSTGISGATAPDAPSNVTITSGDGQITLSWGAAARATSYTIYWKNSSGVTKSDSSITGATSPYVHTGLSNGTAYYYAVSASNAVGESGLSAEVSATPAVVIAGVPTGISVSAGNAKNTVSWNAEANAQSYTIYWSYTPGVTTSSNKITNATSPYTHQPLYNGSSYYYAVTATSTSGIETGLSSEVSAAPQATPPAVPFVANGEVRSIAAASNGTTFIGGDFTKIGPSTGSGVPIDASSGVPISVYPRVTGDVYAVAPDGSGGWYIGGLFTSVGGEPRRNIAHINSNGSVDSSWIPDANEAVWSLAVDGTTIYSGGSFTSIGGQPRAYIAALEAAGSAGAATSWNPGANNTVFALAASAGTIYAGGDFTSIGSGAPTRNHIAALDAVTGSATSWNPDADNSVYSIAVDAGSSTVYIGGNFLTLYAATDPTARSYIAALDSAGTGTVKAWSPDADGTVLALAVSGSTVFAGGSFTSIGSGAPTRNYIAALDTSGTGTATSWNPNADNAVLTLAVSGSTVYAGGDFANIGGAARAAVAALNTTDGAASSWNPDVNSTVWTLAVNGSTVFAGGSFTSVGGQTRNHLASFDLGGNLTSWNPNANNPVSAIAASGSTVYAGGNFTAVGGQTRNYIAALNSWGTGTATTTWNPGADGSVDALAVSGSTIYAGGEFTTMGGATRNFLAAIDAAGTVTGWNPDADNFVYALAVSGDGNRVYAGGDFTHLQSNTTPTTRSHLAAIDAAGTISSWAPSVTGNSVFALATSGTATIYVGGDFSDIEGTARNFIAAVSTATGSVDPSWNPDANNFVNTIAVSADGSSIYAGGDFTSLQSTTTPVTRNHLAAIDSAGNISNSWNPNANSWVNAVVVSGSMVYAGGNFTSVGADPLSYFARISQ